MEAARFEGIRKQFGEVTALHDVSLEVRDGEVLGLLGPNGAGKTTLIRILMDIIRPDAGRVTLFGEPQHGRAVDRLGYLPEERGLYTKRTVLEVMTYFGALKGLSRRDARGRARVWLERVGLAETAGWRVERLSKGMSQKVQIAATLLSEPKLCVLDEPFSGLDPVNVRLVRDLIRERRAAGQTTVLSTHQMGQVDALCDRVALIDRGHLMVYGTVDEVRRRYSLPEVRIAASGEPPAVDGVSMVRHEGGSTWLLLLEEGRSSSDVLSDLVRRGASITRFEEVLAPMEEIFVRVVERERD